MNHPRRPARFVAALAALLLLCGAARAQSTIFNVPSTDVLQPREFYAEADYFGHLEGLDEGGYHSAGTLLVYGLRRGVEVGVNAYYTQAGGGPQPVVVQPNAKWQFYANEEKGVALAASGLLSVPVTRLSRDAVYGMACATASKKLPWGRAPRVTGGGYVLAGPGRGEGARGGALLGVEQTVHPRVTLVADWYTGRNSMGYAAAGGGVGVGRRGYFFAGYNFGNEGRKNNYLAVAYGRSFSF